MKTYEKVALLKQEIRILSNKHGVWESRIGKQKAEFEALKAYHKKIEDAFIETIKETEDHCADFFDRLKAKKEELAEFIQEKRPKELLKPAETNGNGKVICDICHEEFSPQGYPSHHKKCERIRALEDEILKIEGE